MAFKSLALFLALLATALAAPAAAPYPAPAAEPEPQWWQPPPPPQWKPPPPPSWQPPPPPSWQPPPPAWQPPPAPAPNPNHCPAACNVFYHQCDKSTAPECTFPDPFAAQPRAACACKVGYKASGYGDDDSSKQWRLPVKGQEHRVWVAEGVKCDILCKGSGTDACKEVPLLGAQCIGGAP